MENKVFYDLVFRLKSLILDKSFLGTVALISILMFFASLVIIPILIAAIPADYFKKEVPPRKSKISPLSLATKISKNILGILLLMAGILMLVLPGQGLLTILVGLLMVDFPGKRALECKLIRQPTVLKSANWLRKKAGKPPLLV